MVVPGKSTVAFACTGALLEVAVAADTRLALFVGESEGEAGEEREEERGERGEMHDCCRLVRSLDGIGILLD